MVRGDFTTTHLLRWGEGAEVDFGGGLCAGDAGAEGLFEIDAWALAGVAARIINGV